MILFDSKFVLNLDSPYGQIIWEKLNKIPSLELLFPYLGK